MTLSPGTSLSDRWELVAHLASGGMGDVYRARDTRLARDVAIKVLREGVSEGPQRFSREVETLSRFQHPNIVVMFDVGEHDGRPFIVMELIDGPALSEVIREDPLDLDEAARTGAAVASALAYAHDRGIIHRDVKPSNVLYDREGDAHLADFGIAHLADLTAITTTGVAVGTASYVAPEQLTGQDAGPSTDVYSLGLVLLEATTGERAFRGTPTEAALVRLSTNPTIPEGVPAPWRRLLRAMTAREQEARPSAREVADLLDAGLPLERTETLQLPQEETSATTPLGDPGELDGPTGELDEVAPRDAPPREEDRTDGLSPRLRRWAPYLAAALIGVAALIVLVVPGLQEGPGDTPPAERPTTDLPPELDDAFERLLRTVQP